MAAEAKLERTAEGLVPAEDGWFVLNACEAAWSSRDGLGATCEFEGAQPFAQLGINITVLAPGEPMTMYHWEVDQEDFLILSGEALAIIDGQERRLARWDLLHCATGTAHAIVGAGSGPCVVLAVGARANTNGGWGAYPVEEAALRHGAGVEQETTSPREAYARFPAVRQVPYRAGWLDGA
jgi:uncharacterized cupin superfamily protein